MCCVLVSSKSTKKFFFAIMILKVLMDKTERQIKALTALEIYRSRKRQKFKCIRCSGW